MPGWGVARSSLGCVIVVVCGIVLGGDRENKSGGAGTSTRATRRSQQMNMVMVMVMVTVTVTVMDTVMDTVAVMV